MNGELLPCPFCAGDSRGAAFTNDTTPRVEHTTLGWTAGCGTCGARFVLRGSEAEARERWNRRVTPGADVLRAVFADFDALVSKAMPGLDKGTALTLLMLFRDAVRNVAGAKLADALSAPMCEGEGKAPSLP